MVWQKASPLAIETWFALALLGLIVGVFSAYAVRTAVVGRKPDPRVVREGGSILLGAWVMEAFYWAIRAVGRAMVKTGLSPDALTITSLVVTLGSIPAAAAGDFGLAGVLLIVGSVFDAFDGIVARETRTASDAGEVLDAVVDRYADAAPLAGLAIFYRGSIWQMSIPLLAIVGSMMVSYVRAKAEAMRVDPPRTLMRRHERIAYLAVALLVGPLASTWIGERYAFGAHRIATLALVGFIAAISNASALQMTIATRKRLIESGRGPKGAR